MRALWIALMPASGSGWTTPPAIVLPLPGPGFGRSSLRFFAPLQFLFAPAPFLRLEFEVIGQHLHPQGRDDVDGLPYIAGASLAIEPVRHLDFRGREAVVAIDPARLLI